MANPTPGNRFATGAHGNVDTHAPVQTPFPVVPVGGGSTPPPASSKAGGLLGSAFTLDNGWWVFVGCLGAILLSGTRIAPISTGIVGVALIYQINLLLQHK